MLIYLHEMMLIYLDGMMLIYLHDMMLGYRTNCRFSFSKFLLSPEKSNVKELNVNKKLFHKFNNLLRPTVIRMKYSVFAV
jgi:hypothetical protein